MCGINQEIHLYRMQMRPGPNFMLTMISKITKGTMVTEIRVLNDTLLVGDMMRGLSVLSVVETLNQRE